MASFSKLAIFLLCLKNGIIILDSMKTETQSVKSGLAKLMALENLSVVHDPTVTTASFNIKDRILTLPILSDMTDYVYDSFIAHEVGHALYTPFNYSDSCKDFPHHYLNITEDIRIEKMIQYKYPGTRRDFIKFYKDMNDRDFFGIEKIKQDRGYQSVDEFPLADRINLHYKIGKVCPINFQPDEQHIIDACDKIYSFDDAVRVAKLIYDYDKQNNDKQDQNQDNDDQQIASDMLSDDGQDGDDSQDSDDTTSISDDDNRDVDNSDSDDANSDNDNPDDKFAPQTQKNFDDNFQKKQIVASNQDNQHTVFLESPDYSKNYKKIISTYTPPINTLTSADDYYKKFISSIKRTVDIMANDFNLKKSARKYNRTMMASSGRIDRKKLSRYMFDDNIFLTKEVVAEEQNHGMFIVIDWSISMDEFMESNIKQLLILIEFCRKVNIPYEVYTFTTGGPTNKPANIGNCLQSDENLKMCQLFTSSDDTKTHRLKSSDILHKALDNCKSSTGWSSVAKMGYTPINALGLYLPNLIEEFKSKYSNEKVIFTFISDGEANDYFVKDGQNLNYVKDIFMEDKSASTIYKIANNRQSFNHLLNYTKQTTGVSKSVCFYLSDRYEQSALNYFGGDGDRRKFNKDNFCEIENTISFDKFFMVGINNFNIDLDKSVDNKNISKQSSTLKQKYLTDSMKITDSKAFFMRKFIDCIS